MKILRFKYDSEKTMKPYCLFLEDGTKLSADTNDLFIRIKESEIIQIERFGLGKKMLTEIVKVDKVFKNNDGIWTIEYNRDDDIKGFE